jgi:hypothetical protein
MMALLTFVVPWPENISADALIRAAAVSAERHHALGEQF